VLRLTVREERATSRVTSAAATAPTYARLAPERTLLYALVQAYYPDFIARLTAQDRLLPATVREEFEAFLRCGVLEQGFLRVVCEQCHAERLLAFSCKRRGFCPSCVTRRMAESTRHLVDGVFGPRPVRQWVLSVPLPLRLLFALRPPVPLSATRNASWDAFAGRCFLARLPSLPRRNGFAIACAGIRRKQAPAKAQAARLTIWCVSRFSRPDSRRHIDVAGFFLRVLGCTPGLTDSSACRTSRP